MNIRRWVMDVKSGKELVDGIPRKGTMGIAGEAHTASCLGDRIWIFHAEIRVRNFVPEGQEKIAQDFSPGIA
jgi:hypothetical protein